MVKDWATLSRHVSREWIMPFDLFSHSYRHPSLSFIFKSAVVNLSSWVKFLTQLCLRNLRSSLHTCQRHHPLLTRLA